MKNTMIISVIVGVILGALTGTALKHFDLSIIPPEIQGPNAAAFSGAIYGGLLTGVMGTILGLIVGSGGSDVYRGGLFGVPLGAAIGVAVTFIAQPTDPNGTVSWGLLCGSIAGLILGMRFSNPLRGFERLSPAKRKKAIDVLRRRGPAALPMIKLKARTIQQRGIRVVDRGDEFDFDPAIELQELAFEIESEHGIGIGGIMGSTKQKPDKDA